MAKEDENDVRVIEGESGDDGETVVVDEKVGQQQASKDERVAQREDDEDESDGRTPEEVEAIRAQRRIERRAKKQREHAARDSNRRELDFLRARNEKLERRFSEIEQRTYQSEYTQADGQLATIEGQLRQADAIMAKAVKDGDGASLTEAQNIKDELREAKRRLIAQKDDVVRQSREAAAAPREEPQQRAQPEQVDPELMAHANRWKAANSWYTADTTPKADEDRAITNLIDTRLAQEGYDPGTAEYWSELTDRLKERLPHRFANGGRSNGNGNGRGPAMANGARERSLKPGEMYVSAERKQALMEAGMWDDIPQRNKYLKAYADYDREAAAKNA